MFSFSLSSFATAKEKRCHVGERRGDLTTEGIAVTVTVPETAEKIRGP